MRVFAPFLLTLLSTPAVAAPQVGDNFLGGRVVEKMQFFALTGYPDTQVGVRIRLPGTFELTPTVRFAYPVGGHGTHPTPLGLTTGLDLRWQVFTEGDWSGAIVGSLPVHVGFEPRTHHVPVGVGLVHPGFAVTVAVQQLVDIDFGVQFQDDLWFREGHVWFTGAVPFFFGAELEVVDRVAVGVRFEGGPAFTVGDHRHDLHPAVGARIRGTAGVAYSF